MPRFEVPSLKFRGAIARAMGEVHEHHDRRRDISGTIACPWCKASLRFTVLMDGKSRGTCTGSCGVRWVQ
jgi:hypothetical protein